MSFGSGGHWNARLEQPDALRGLVKRFSHREAGSALQEAALTMERNRSGTARRMSLYQAMSSARWSAPDQSVAFRHQPWMTLPILCAMLHQRAALTAGERVNLARKSVLPSQSRAEHAERGTSRTSVTLTEIAGLEGQSMVSGAQWQ